MSTDEGLGTEGKLAPENHKTKNQRYEIKWHYSPSDFFPVPAREQVFECSLAIDQGAAIAIIEPDVYESDPLLQQMLGNYINARCVGQQLRTAREYELRPDSVTEHHWDGRHTIHKGISARMATWAADHVERDSSGRVLFDSGAGRRQEEFRHQQKEGDLQRLEEQLEAAVEQHCRKVAPPEAPMIDSLLASLVAARRDPDNELVYLYEMREALTKRFGGEPLAQRALSVSDSQWRRFGQLANNAPVSQGRHRGKFTGQLRPATEEELIEARSFAEGLLLAFLRLL